jgi:hypothetical protein
MLFFVLFSCGKAAIQKETELLKTRGKEGHFFQNYQLFRNNLEKFVPVKYSFTNLDYFTALSNEFVLDTLYSFSFPKEKSISTGLSNAIAAYEKLLKDYPDEADFLYQRIGICHYKNENYRQAYSTILLALSLGAANSEIYFYQSLLFLNYKKDPKNALESLKRAKNDELFINRQDYLAFQAFLYNNSGGGNQALTAYWEAKSLNPVRFYENYDLLPLYLEKGKIEEAKSYAQESWKILSQSKTPYYRLKACQQKIRFNQLSGAETAVFDLDLSDVFNYYHNILYFYKPVFPIRREKSKDLEIPLQEKKKASADKVYYSFFEDYSEWSNTSEIFLLEGVFDSTSVGNSFPKLSPPVSKYIIANSTALLLSPTNVFVILTNSFLPTNSRSYIISNQSNLIYSQALDCNYYFAAQRFSVDQDQVWDYILVGFDAANRLKIFVFYPDKRKWDKFQYSIESSSAKVVVQDINQDGKSDFILLDKDVVFLKPEKTP